MSAHVGKWTIRFCQLIQANPNITQTQIKALLEAEGADKKQVENIITHRDLYGDRINKFPVGNSTFVLNERGIGHAKLDATDARTTNRTYNKKPKTPAPSPAPIPLSNIDSELDQIVHAFSDQYSHHLAQVIIDDITAKLPALILHGLAERFGNPQSLFSETMATIKTAFPVSPPPADSLGDVMKDAKTIKPHLLDTHVKPGVASEPPKIPHHSPTMRPTPKPAELIKVGIVGLLPMQMEIMNDEFGDFFDLRMPEKPVNGDKLWAIIADTKFVITMTKFVNHTHTDTTAKHPGSILVHGGISSLKMKLDEIRRQEMAAKAA